MLPEQAKMENAQDVAKKEQKLEANERLRLYRKLMKELTPEKKKEVLKKLVSLSELL